MIAFLRLAVVGLVGLTLVYWLVRVYARSVRREELEKDWAADHPDGGDPDARDAHIETGMADYERSLRRKLILLVYVLPAIAVAVIIYLTNYQ